MTKLLKHDLEERLLERSLSKWHESIEPISRLQSFVTEIHYGSGHEVGITVTESGDVFIDGQRVCRNSKVFQHIAERILDLAASDSISEALFAIEHEQDYDKA